MTSELISFTVDHTVGKILQNKWGGNVVSFCLQGKSRFGAVLRTPRDLDWTFFVFFLYSSTTGSSAERKAEKRNTEKDEGGWFSSITTRFMRQHGSGCAAMATVFHWPTDEADLCVSVIAAEQMCACVCVCVRWRERGEHRGWRREAEIDWWSGEREREKEREAGVRRPCSPLNYIVF